MGAQTSYPDLYELLSRQPQARIQQIAEAWGGTARSPGELCTLMVSDRERFRARLLDAGLSKHTGLVLVDAVQDFGMPVTLYPEDHEAKTALSSLGLIYPYPVDWGGVAPRQAQRVWTMPVEIAILCAQVVPIYRPRLPLMLGMLEPKEIARIGRSYGLDLSKADLAAGALHLATHMLTEQPLVDLLLDPEFQDHLFALQILFEWHGICHRQELFSFAWGDDTVKPLTARGMQTRERWIEDDLKRDAFIFAYTPPEHDTRILPVLREIETEDETEEVPSLLVLPEELRPVVWLVGRQLQEEATNNLIAGLGGWSPTPEMGPGPEQEPTDRLKALGCLLETRDAPVSVSEIVGQLAALEEGHGHGPEPWAALIDLARIAGFVETTPDSQQDLRLTHGGAQVADEGPEEFSRMVLSQWVQGVGPESLDAAQNRALGLAEEWQKTVLPLVRGTHHRAPALDAWWEIANTTSAAPGSADDRRPRRFRRPVPTWLLAAGVDSELDMSCGCPRPTPDRDALLDELQLVEGVVTTFRLLLLDVLSGLPSESPLLLSELGVLAQEIAALSVQLNLAVMLLDVTGQTFIPVHPPTVIVERMTDDLFDNFAVELVDKLLVPSGAVVREGDTLRILPYRNIVQTPKWVDARGRREALASLVGVESDAIASRVRLSSHRLRAVPMRRHETEGRFWLGRPYEDLRRAVAGRSVTAVVGSFLEVS